MFGLGNAARGRHQQRPAEVGSGFIEHIGRVGDHDAGAGGGVDIDVVIANRHVGDRFQARARGEQLRVHPLAHGREQADLALEPVLQLRGTEDVVVGVVFDVEVLAQAFEHFGKDGARHQYAGLHG